jgi:hypothetical protein
MATKIQIREYAAETLGILGEGETLPSYEADDLDQAYDRIYEELQGLGLAPWASTADIPDKYASSVAMLVAEACAVKYQIPDNRYQRIKLEGKGVSLDGQAIKMLRKLQAVEIMGQTRIENI